VTMFGGFDYFSFDTSLASAPPYLSAMPLR
jgi:hypothetical protein